MACVVVRRMPTAFFGNTYIIVRVFGAHHMSSMIVSEVSVSVVSVLMVSGCVCTLEIRIGAVV